MSDSGPGLARTQWADTHAVPPLGAVEVHVWHLSVASIASEAAALRGLLHHDEREREERFHANADRDRFLVARAVLRILLGRYTGGTAAALQLETQSHGKLRLPSAPSDLTFNISHSGDVVLVAVAGSGSVGVDVEQVKHRPVEDLSRIATRAFAEVERRALATVADEHKSAHFYRTWSRKEAYIKGIGSGVSHGLDRFHVYDEAATPLDCVRDETVADTWWMHDLHPGDGYAGAVATTIRDARIDTFAMTLPLLRALL